MGLSPDDPNTHWWRIGGTIWHNGAGHGRVVADLYGSDDPTTCDAQSNAERIVRCVNAHDELVRMLMRSSEIMRLAADEKGTLLSDEAKSYLYGQEHCNMMLLERLEK